jgi:hypothetical protein
MIFIYYFESVAVVSALTVVLEATAVAVAVVWVAVVVVAERLVQVSVSAALIRGFDSALTTYMYDC